MKDAAGVYGGKGITKDWSKALEPKAEGAGDVSTKTPTGASGEAESTGISAKVKEAGIKGINFTNPKRDASNALVPTGTVSRGLKILQILRRLLHFPIIFGHRPASKVKHDKSAS